MIFHFKKYHKHAWNIRLCSKNSVPHARNKKYRLLKKSSSCDFFPAENIAETNILKLHLPKGWGGGRYTHTFSFQYF